MVVAVKYTLLIITTLYSYVFGEEISFDFQMALEDNGNIQMLKTPNIGTGNYRFFKFENDKWVTSRNIKVFVRRNLIVSGTFSGESGRYKIVRNAVPLSPYSLEKIIEVRPELNGKQLKFLHQKEEVQFGVIRLINKEGEPFPNIGISKVFDNVVFIENEKYSRHGFSTGLTNNEGEVGFKFIDRDELKFYFRNYRIKPGFSNTWKSFTAEDLSSAANWIVEEHPVRAVFMLYIKTDDEVKKITGEQARELFGERATLALFKYTPGSFRHSQLTNISEISIDYNGLVFRGLPTDTKLKIGNEIEGNGNKFSVASVEEDVFKIAEDEIHRGVLILSDEPIEDKVQPRSLVRLKLTVAGNEKVESAWVQPLNKNTNILKQRYLSDSDGFVTMSLPDGTYQFTISKRLHEDKIFVLDVDADIEKTVTVNKVEDVHINIEWEEGLEETIGEIYLYSAHRAGPVFTIPVLDQKKITIPKNFEGPVLLNFHSRPHGGQEVEFSERSRQLSIKDVDFDQNQEITFVVSDAKTVSFIVSGLPQTESRILLYQTWNDRLLPVGLGHWKSEKDEKTFLRAPDYGTFIPLLIFDAKSGESSETMACWGEEIRIDETGKSVNIKAKLDTIHRFGNPYSYRSK